MMIDQKCIICGGDWNQILLKTESDPEKSLMWESYPICQGCIDKMRDKDILSKIEQIEKENLLNFKDYQIEAHKTSIEIENFRLLPNQVYAMLGKKNEKGEVKGLLKKALRGDFGEDPALNYDFLSRLKKEIGDNLWYLAETCTRFNLSLATVAAENIEKLRDRQERGVIMGSGDDR